MATFLYFYVVIFRFLNLIQIAFFIQLKVTRQFNIPYQFDEIFLIRYYTCQPLIYPAHFVASHTSLRIHFILIS